MLPQHLPPGVEETIIVKNPFVFSFWARFLTPDTYEAQCVGHSLGTL